jgi:hypothetical protein
MSEMKIRTNNHPRDLISWQDLTAKEKKELDWIVNPQETGYDFFRYRGYIYALANFIRIEKLADDSPLKGWEGQESESYFSGTLVKYARDDAGRLDSERVIVGRYCC